ncbi:MAG: FIST N-terminal domain-containing protein [Bacteroidia bacterium]|nr:FIST C-terminal domain-containing protein [Bacteroidia bacterium]MDW8158189.1 FIST N-terminal domain-containing protein [Bacteroidia bacterium]
MKAIVAVSKHNSPVEAASEIAKGLALATEPLALVVVFASSAYDPNTLATELGKQITVPFIGCTTAGEFASGIVLKNGIVALGLFSSLIRKVSIAAVENLSSGIELAQPLEVLAAPFGKPLSELDVRKHVGLVFVDGLSKAEEKLMEKLGDSTDIIFVGGSAGDDLKFQATYVFANGKAYTNAAVLALLEPAVPYKIVKTQSFRVLNQKLVATKVNEKEREVLEFNGLPAAKAYAQALGTTEEQLPNFFMQNPVGLIADTEPFVRSPQQVKSNSVIFYCNVLEGMELALLDSTDIVKDTHQALQQVEKELGSISAILNFHCILRTLQLMQTPGKLEEYAQLFKAYPSIGFSTYGEQYLGHINQTSTMLVFA